MKNVIQTLTECLESEVIKLQEVQKFIDNNPHCKQVYKDLRDNQQQNVDDFRLAIKLITDHDSK